MFIFFFFFTISAIVFANYCYVKLGLVQFSTIKLVSRTDFDFTKVIICLVLAYTSRVRNSVKSKDAPKLNFPLPRSAVCE